MFNKYRAEAEKEEPGSGKNVEGKKIYKFSHQAVNEKQIQLQRSLGADCLP